MLSQQLNDKIQTLVHGKPYTAKINIEVKIGRDSEGNILISGSRKVILLLSKQLRIKMHSRNSFYIDPTEEVTPEHLIMIAKEIKGELEILPNTEVNYSEIDHR